MNDSFRDEPQIQCVNSFQELVATPFHGDINAMCWMRELTGDFEEIVQQVKLEENIAGVTAEDLRQFKLSAQGQLARETILNDLALLNAHGSSPVLNVLEYYERDEHAVFFPTDVYSFHVDRSPIPTETFLCTYTGAPTEILPNTQGEQKVLIPEIREALRKRYGGPEEGFATFLAEHFFDLHYQAKANAKPISLGRGHLWKLAVDHPGSTVLPCLHRAPKEREGEKRLLLIC